MKEPIINPDTVQDYETKPHFRTENKGVYFIKIKHSDGETREEPILLSDPLDVIGRGTDESGAYYTVIQFKDPHTRQAKIAAIANAEIGTPQCWQRLQGMGLTVYSGRAKREFLADYLQTQGSRAHFHIVNQSGWHKGVYVLPNGEIISPHTSEPPPRIIYNGDKSQAHAYHTSGSLKDWQEQIAQYANGNSRLCLALGTAFAAPLLSLMRVESGGFHLYGNSRDGKTTAAKVGLSVWSKHDDSLMTWQGTKLGFNNTATARNDGLLVLDEISQATPKVVSDTVYSVMNGINKAQGAKDGGNRAVSRWRVLVLSTGELSPENMLGNQAEWNAGQAVRLPTLEANAGREWGIYDILHGFADGAELSEHLDRAAAHYHGMAGREFIRLLNQDGIKQAQAHFDDFMAMLPKLSGQARTVAKRFALAAAALELATPITGLAAGVGMAGVKRCFDDWLFANGTGNRENERIVRQFKDFMEQFAYSERFQPLKNNDFSHTDRHHAGFYDDTSEPPEWYIIEKVFREEIAQLFGIIKVTKVLEERDLFIKGSRGNGKTQRKFRGSMSDFYRVRECQE